MNATPAMVASACAGIVSLGRLDLDPRSLIPKGAGVEIVTASSDHLILDLTDAAPVEVGDKVEFSRVWLSAYVGDEASELLGFR